MQPETFVALILVAAIIAVATMTLVGCQMPLR